MTKNFKEPTTLVELLRLRAQHQPSQQAYTFLKDGETEKVNFTYTQLDRSARVIAAKLQDMGMASKHALLLYPPGLDYIAAFFGCLYAGVVAVPTYPPRRNRLAPRFQTLVADAQATVILTTTDILSDMASHLTHAPELKNLPWLATDNLTDELAELWQVPKIYGDTLAFLQYTSGATSKPKGVMVNHSNLLYNEEMIRQGFEHTENTKFVGWLPLFHDMGLIGNLLQPLYLGIHCILMSPMAFLQKPFWWLQAISHYQATTSGGPNFAYDLCVQKITTEQRAQLDLSSWEVAFCGAEPIRAQTLERFSKTFADCGFRREAFYPCYGLAETTLFVSGGLKTAHPIICQAEETALEQNRVVLPSGEEKTRSIVGCGHTWLEQKIVIVNPKSCLPCSEQQVGEIWVSGPNVAQGYWNRTEETQQTFHAYLADTGEGPFLRTGDLGFLRNGELFVTGRLKELIIIRGRNHYPQDIELTVETCHSALAPNSGAAFSLERKGEERLVIVQEVQRTYLRHLDVDEVVNTIRQVVFEQHELPVDTVLLLKTGSLSKTSSGKIQRRVCREQFLVNELKGVVGEWRQDTSPDGKTAESIQNWLVTKISEQLKIAPTEINIRESLANYAFDSVTVIGLSEELETWLGRKLSPTLVYDYPNIAAIAQYLTEPHRLENKTVAVASKTVTEDIAIIGMGCRFPGTKNPQEFWHLLREGRDAITEVPSSRWDANTFYDPNPDTAGKMNTRWGGFLDEVAEFDAQFFGISPREANQMDPQQRLLLEVSWEALEHAGIAPEQLAGSQTGVFIGIITNDYAHLQSKYNLILDAYSGTGNASSIAANRLSYFFDLRGPSIAIDTACSASLVAVHQACQHLRQDECHLALAGGVNIILNPDLTIIFSQAKMTAPDGRCKTFDASANGYVRGEGCGIVVLKRFSDAIKDGDNILAIIKGSAINQDGHSNGLTTPNSLSQQAVIRQALKNAKLSPAQLNYVEAHGTGTSLGDPIEVNALKEVLMEDRFAEQPCWIGSVKTNIGHLEAAAGIAGLIKVVLSLQHREIFPHLHFKELNPLIAIADTSLKIPTQREKWEIPPEGTSRFAGVSSFGFGGTNAHVVIGEAPKAAQSFKTSKVSGEPPKHLFTLSAKSEFALREFAQRYKTYLDSHSEESIADICFTVNTGRSHFDHRLAFVTESVMQLREQLGAFLTGKQSDSNGQIPPKLVPERLQNLYDLYIRGVSVDWAGFYQSSSHRRIALPTYPFQRQRYWFETTQKTKSFSPEPIQTSILELISQGEIEALAQQLEKASHFSVTKQQLLPTLKLLIQQHQQQVRFNAVQEWLYQLTWLPKSHSTPNIFTKAQSSSLGSWLIFADQGGVGQALAQLLQHREQHCILVYVGERYTQTEADNIYAINPDQPTEFEQLLQDTHSHLTGVVHLWNLDAVSSDNLTSQTLAQAQTLGCESVLLLVQALVKQHYESISLWLVTRNAVPVITPVTEIAQAPLWGLGKVISLEHPKIWGGMIDLGLSINNSKINDDATTLLTEILENDAEDQIAYREGQRYVARLVATKPDTIGETSMVRFAEDYSYLITGGLGALGLRVAKWMVAQGAKHLILIARRQPSKQAQAVINQLQESGVEVLVEQADVAHEVEIAAVFDKIANNQPPLRGIIHAAGVLGFEALSEITLETMQAVLRPKVQGAWLLHQQTRQMALDFFVCFSSIASVWGSHGQAHYAAANHFLDVLAHYRRGLSLPALTINWGPWAEGGMMTPEAQSLLKQRGVTALSPDKAIETLAYLLGTDECQSIVAEVNWSLFKELYTAQQQRFLLEQIEISETTQPPQLRSESESPSIVQQLAQKNTQERDNFLKTYLQGELAKTLEFDSNQLPALEQSFFDMGVDSLMAVELKNKIAKQLGTSLPTTMLFDYPNIQALSTYLIQTLDFETRDVDTTPVKGN